MNELSLNARAMLYRAISDLGIPLNVLEPTLSMRDRWQVVNYIIRLPEDPAIDELITWLNILKEPHNA